MTPTLQQWPRLLAFAQECQLDDHSTMILEEAMANVVNYSGATEVEVKVAFSDESSPRRLSITLIDDGVYFDPTTYIPDDSEELMIGGQGIRLIRALSDSISYIRENEKNILTIIKSL